MKDRGYHGAYAMFPEMLLFIILNRIPATSSFNSFDLQYLVQHPASGFLVLSHVINSR